MGSTLAGFFLAGFFLVMAGAVGKLNAWLPWHNEWKREFAEKSSPIFLRWGLRVWIAGIVFLLLGTVPLIAWPALALWVGTRIAKKMHTDDTA
jgi:hypothetical protein